MVMKASDGPSGQDLRVFDAALYVACTTMGVHISRANIDGMWAHYCRILEANREFNLTRIVLPVDAAIKHYADSLALLACGWFDCDGELTLLDVGTGGGFPAIPLAIMCGGWRISAIDGTGKKIRFVEAAAEALGLVNVRARHARAADLAKEGQTGFDVVVLRAVGKLADGLREVHDLVAPGGSVVFYKTKGIGADELAAGKEAAGAFGLRETDRYHVTIPSPDGLLERMLIRYEHI